jgi:hypothetical protein
MALKEYMNESKLLNKWHISIIFIIGMFAGAVLATMCAMLGLLTW